MNAVTGVPRVHTGSGRPEASATSAAPPLDDWLTMFDAVRECLSSSALDRPPVTRRDRVIATNAGGLAQLRSVMLGCAGALGQLRASLGEAMPGASERATPARLGAEPTSRRDARVADPESRRLDAHRAPHDAWTAWPDRAGFTHRLQDALAPKEAGRRPLTVLFVGLDRVDLAEATPGASVDDESLRIVALRMRSAMRAGDVVGRFGVDAFACVLPGLEDALQIVRIADDMRAAAAAPLRRTADGHWRARASIGVARAPHDGTRCDTLLQHAGAALDRARRSGTGLAF